MDYPVNKNNYTPIHVANYLISLAHQDGVKDLTQLKLIKLVYIVYAWNLCLQDERLFKESIEAWPYGPVAPSLYHSIKHYGNHPVDKLIKEYEYNRKNDQPKETIPTLENDDPAWKIAYHVWDTYKNISASELVSKLHEPESAWQKTIDKGSMYDTIDIKDINAAAVRGIKKHLQE